MVRGLTRKDKLVRPFSSDGLPVVWSALDGLPGALREMLEQVSVVALNVVHITITLFICAHDLMSSTCLLVKCSIILYEYSIIDSTY